MPLPKVPGWTKAFLQHLRCGRTETQACIGAGCRQSMVQDLREHDPAFAQEMDDAAEMGRVNPSQGVKGG